jgi:pyruvate-ferredoxin/flavodoxin oxidoreductase
MGGNDQHTVKAFQEAESWNGPSLILAYAHCIAHGYDLVHGLEQQKNAVLSAYWPLFRYDPRRTAEGKNPFQLDSRAATLPLDQYIYKETRYNMLVHSNPEVAKQLLKEAEQDVRVRWKMYEQMAAAPPADHVAAVKAAGDAKVEATKEAK